MAIDLDKTWFGWNAPFFGGQQGVLSRQTGLRIIKNDLKQLILTMPGERVMRPDWGTTLGTIVFDNASSDLLDNVSASIVSAINTQDRRVNPTVSYVVDEDNHKVTFTVVGYAKTGEPQPFEMIFEV